MVIVIVGGGKLGFDLAQTMMERKYDVRLIEKNKAKCMELANRLDAEVICGDGTEIEILEEAGTKNCHSIIAVTGSDQDNLVATQLAKREFDAKKVKEDVIAWIRNWFDLNGPGCNAIVAISGGKDSSVVAALCTEALGKDRVIGVLLPRASSLT